MNWDMQPLESVADFCLGKMLDKRKNKGDLRPYLANVNVRWGEIVLDDLREMRFQEHEIDRFGLKVGDIVMCEGGEPGRCALWKGQRPGMMIQKALHRIRPHDCLNHEFLFYLFMFYGQNGHFAPLFTGSTIKHLPREKLALLEVPVPPIGIQRKIASVLSAYDDLIENNTRRIAILEEMAQAVYREWFVNFKFPGHENAKFVESELGKIPEGWKATNLKEVCAEKKGIQTGPFGSQLHRSDYTDEGTPVVMPKDISSGRILVDSIARVPDEIVERLPRHVLEFGDTVCARRGEIGRNAFVADRETGWMCGTGCMRIRPRTGAITPRFLFDFLCWPETVSLIAGKAAGAIMPNLNIGIMESVPILLPPIEVLELYEDKAMEFLSLIGVLAKKNKNLRATRDLLLSKLVSGQLNVEVLDIDTGIENELLEATA